MPEVGVGVYEIRINIGDAFRVFYVAKFEDYIYVCMSFRRRPERHRSKISSTEAIATSRSNNYWGSDDNACH